MSSLPPRALVLFDIDGTLLRRAGPHRHDALAVAVRNATGIAATPEGVAVVGMLDRAGPAQFNPVPPGVN